MNHRDALAVLDLPADASWSQIEAALARRLGELRRRREAEGSTRSVVEEESSLRDVRRALFGPLGASPAFERLLDEGSDALPGDGLGLAGEAGELTIDDGGESVPQQVDSGQTRSEHQAEPIEADSEEAPDSVGRFVTRQLLLRTPHVSVWAGYDPKDRAKLFIKRYTRLVPWDDREELERELKALMAIDHPRIAAIRDCELQNRRLVVAQEAPPGSLLRDEVEYRGREGKFPVARAENILDQLCEALSVVHNTTYFGGVSPDSIWIDSGDYVTLDLTQGQVFRKHGLLGPVQENSRVMPYLAPEELNPDEQADHHSDEFGVAAVIYELLAGGTFHELRRPLRDVNPLVPRNLSDTIMRALSTNVRKRFRSLNAFWRACIKKRRLVPLSTFLLPAAAAALVLCLSLSYLHYLDPILRTARERQRATTAASEAELAYRGTLTPMFIQSGEKLNKLEQLAKDTAIHPDIGGALLEPINQLRAWQISGWKRELNIENEPDGEFDPKRAVDAKLHAAKADMERGELLRRQDKLHAAQLAFADARTKYLLIAVKAPDEDGDKKEPSPLAAFCKSFDEVIDLETTLLRGRKVYRTLEDRSKEFAAYARSWEQAAGTNETQRVENLGREVIARGAEYNTAWDNSQAEFVRLVQSLPRMKTPKSSEAEFYLNRMREATKAAEEDLESFRTAYYSHLMKTVSAVRDETTRKLSEADGPLSTLGQVAAGQLDEFVLDVESRNWLRDALVGLRERHQQIKDELARLRLVDMARCEADIALVQGMKEATDSEKLGWLADALREFHRIDVATREKTHDLLRLNAGAKQLDDLTQRHNTLAQKFVAAREAVRWWERFDESAPGDYATIASKNLRPLREAHMQLVSLESAYLEAVSGDSNRSTADEYALRMKRLRAQAIKAIADWDTISKTSLSVRETMTQRAQDQLAQVVAHYEEVLEKVQKGMQEKAAQIADSVARKEQADKSLLESQVNNISAFGATSQGQKGGNPQDEEQLLLRQRQLSANQLMQQDLAEKEKRKLNAQIDEVKRDQDAMRRTFESLKQSTDNTLLLADAKRLDASQFDSGADTGRALMLGKKLNELVENATVSLDKQFLTDTLGISDSIDTSPPLFVNNPTMPSTGSASGMQERSVTANYWNQSSQPNGPLRQLFQSNAPRAAYYAPGSAAPSAAVTPGGAYAPPVSGGAVVPPPPAARRRWGLFEVAPREIWHPFTP